MIDPSSDLGLIALVAHARDVAQRGARGLRATPPRPSPTTRGRSCSAPATASSCTCAGRRRWRGPSAPPPPRAARRRTAARGPRRRPPPLLGRRRTRQRRRGRGPDPPPAPRLPVGPAHPGRVALPGGDRLAGRRRRSGLHPVLASACSRPRPTWAARRGRGARAPPRSLADVALDRIVAGHGSARAPAGAGRRRRTHGAPRGARRVAGRVRTCSSRTAAATGRQPSPSTPAAASPPSGPHAPLPEVDAIVLAISAPLAALAGGPR